MKQWVNGIAGCCRSWRDADGARQQSCVKSLLGPPLLFAACIALPENKIDRNGEIIPSVSSLKQKSPLISVTSSSGKAVNTAKIGLIKPLKKANKQKKQRKWLSLLATQYLSMFAKLISPLRRFDVNNQLDFLSTAKKGNIFYLINFHLSTRSPTCLTVWATHTLPCTQMSATWMPIRG